MGNNLQSVDYTYNIRGWLSGINAGDLNNLGNKLFAYKIKHTEREGVETPNNEYPELKVTPHYNGSITETDWKIAADNVKRRYGYTYDATSRMTGGFYQTDTNPYLKEYNEIVDYDLNGNIASLKRTSFSMAGTPLIIDDLTYAYDGNRLTTVSDASQNYTGYPANTPSLIDYDENGNMISLKDKGISQIVYNHLDLPSYVTYAQSYFVHDNITGLDVEKNVNTQYTYRSDGTKLKAEYTYVTGKGKIETKRKTDYLDNFQYENDVLQFTANEEGYYDFKNNRYIYNYTDHLGNVRVSYYKNTTTGNATILEENHYYPLGLRHTGYSPTLAGNAYRYKYNGKELQENGMLDYGWRNYIPELGRWGVMDQLSENYHMASPYAYVMNNPVSLIDPDGRNVHETATGWTFDGADISLIMSYLRNGGGVKHLTQELSVWGGGGGGGGGTSMYGGAISSFWSSFNSGGILGGVSVSGGYLSWWTNGAPASGNSIQGVDNHKTKIEQNSFNSFMNGLTNLKNYFSSLNKDFTSLANNQYFSAGHLITSESVSRFGAYSLSKALKPDYSVNYTVLDDAAKPYRITTMAGIKMKPATAATLSKVAKFGGYFLAGVSVYATEAQYADGSIGDTERWANHIMTGVGMVPTPWTMGIALGYGIITGGYQAITGRSIFNDMGLGPQKK
ncbi:RHS repeat-associated core domain-containing protein [Chryseobacterium nepalense]|uniref:RHS repeat protein n=1 Tax=Chryseobacterium nepalense TaxID=1854498 RepID=UPI002E039E6C|nr:RHS repeat-associated protein [Chryseobacterium nepalense]